MLLIILRNSFIIIALWLFFTMAFRKVLINKISDNVKQSEFVAFIGLLIMLYSIVGLLLMFFVFGWTSKIVLLLCSIAPFIIGKLATYEKEELFSFIQLIIVLGSVIYVNFHV